MALRKQKSRKQQVADLAVDYLKLKAAGKAAKGAGKGAKKAAKGTAVYKVAQEDADREADPGRRRRRRGRARRDEGRQGPRRPSPRRDLIPPLIPAPAALDARPGEPSRCPTPSSRARPTTGAPESYRLEISDGGVTFARRRRRRPRARRWRRCASSGHGAAAGDRGRAALRLARRHARRRAPLLRRRRRAALIDLAALYKLNVLHLHLTDDQGWRFADRRAGRS